MPVKKCTENNKSGYKWGDSGKCYTGPDAKKQAIRQGIAIEGPDKFAKKVRANEIILTEKEYEYVDDALACEGLGIGDRIVYALNLKGYIQNE